MCHGLDAKGDGTVSIYLQNKPADLTSLPVQALSDGGIFLTDSQGIPGKMPALNEKHDRARTLGCGELYPYVEVRKQP